MATSSLPPPPPLPPPPGSAGDDDLLKLLKTPGAGIGPTPLASSAYMFVWFVVCFVL